MMCVADASPPFFLNILAARMKEKKLRKKKKIIAT